MKEPQPADAVKSGDSESLKKRVLRAGGWSIAGYATSQAIRLGSTLIMTRLLAPEMFGVMTIATMVAVILNLLSDIGLRQNIVQSRRGDEREFLDTAWTLQIARGVLLWAIALLLCFLLHHANLAGSFPPKSVYSAPELPYVIAVSSFSAVILGFESTKTATAYRRFEQKRIVQIELIGQILALIAMIAIGVATRSIWALVAGGLVATLSTTVLSHAWMRGPANRLRIDTGALRELAGFGKWVIVSSAVSVLASQGDRLLLGALMDAELLGIFAIAALIARAFENALQKLYMTVALPALSEVARSDPGRLGAVYYKLCFPSDLLLLFLTGFLFASGQLIIALLYDPRYSAAGGMLQILALSLFAVRYGVAQQIYLALGKPRYLAIVNVVRVVSLYTLVPGLFITFGPMGAIWGIALHSLSIVPFVYAFNVRLGLIDLRRELGVLLVLPLGYLAGSALNHVRG